MNDSNDILGLVRPLLKGWPVLLLCIIAALSLGYLSVRKSKATYQASVSIRIQDKESQVNEVVKNIEMFSSTGALMTEIEVLRSRYLVGRALDNLDFRVCYYRKARSGMAETYHRSPFRIEYAFSDSNWMDHMFTFQYAENETLSLHAEKDDTPVNIEGKLGDTLSGAGFWVRILRAEASEGKNPAPFTPDEYGFEVFSRRRLITQYTGKDLLVKMLDKEIPILKIYMNHDVPKKAQLFANALAEAYISEYINNKKEAAYKTLAFIDQEIERVSADLRSSELALESYKRNNKLLDLSLIADAEIKKSAQLELQRIALQMERTQISQVERYLREDIRDSKPVPDYGSVQDPVFRDRLSRLGQLQTQRREFLLKYTDIHPSVKALDEEMVVLRKDLLESIERTLKTQDAQIGELQAPIDENDVRLNMLPEAERQLVSLKRQFALNERAYDFLMNKRAEAAIGAAATISFHKILEPATEPKEPINSLKKVILAISGFMGFLTGAVGLFFRHYLRNAVYSTGQIAEHLDLPLLGIAHRSPAAGNMIPQDFINIASRITSLTHKGLVAVCSGESASGKTFVTRQLAHTLRGLGYKVLIADADFHHPELHLLPPQALSPGLSEFSEGSPAAACIRAGQIDVMPAGSCGRLAAALFQQGNIAARLKELLDRYDFVIADSPRLDIGDDSMPLLREADLCVVVARSDHSRMKTLIALQERFTRYGITSGGIVLNRPREKSSRNLLTRLESA
ncbi:MAG: hypothetical protein EAZ89_17555 [Bacteroidetes bacterium]|nr:MAG: hypothetical protein EAZ89_17555 [Bacteroidota bacterium]